MKDTILSITPDSFDAKVLLEVRPVLMAYISRDYDYAAQTGVLCSIAKKYGERITACLLKENSISTFRELGIDGSPAFIIFHRGKEKGRMLGKADELTLNSFIKKTLPDLEGGDGYGKSPYC